MEFYLVVEDHVVRDVKYYTEGCDYTRRCGQAVARRANGKNIYDALAIHPREIIDSEESLPEDGRHCAILAVSTLYRAIADHLLTP
jgi:NifU-like protein involved in Fe-S cluster formation